MSTRRAGVRLALLLAASALLASCAVERPKPKPATVTAHPESPPTTVTSLPPALGPNQPWASMTARFTMHDCNDSPLVRAELATYTRSPAHFEDLLRQALPLMMYVQKQLAAAGVPGEFVMLPMLESSYNTSEPSRRGDPAGMWQLMPHTARRYGLTIDAAYDGRLDPIASTQAAIGMLKAFDRQFGDWRLVDLAYNAGSGAVANALQAHPHLGDGAIPDIGLSATSRKHLAKLMALSCIIREPQRFHVTLPEANPDDLLQAVRVPKGMQLQAIASMAGLPESTLRTLNPGYLGSRIPAQSPGKLLLPASAGAALAAALEKAPGPVAQVDTQQQDPDPDTSRGLPEKPNPPQPSTGPAKAGAAGHHHVVRKGETLWSIAHRYHVTIGELKRWNHLSGDDITPGQDLRVRK